MLRGPKWRDGSKALHFLKSHLFPDHIFVISAVDQFIDFCRSHRSETAGGLPRLCERIHRMFRAAVLCEGVRRAGGGRKAVSKNRIDRAANSLVMVRLLICQTVYREHREPPARKLY